MDGPSLEMIVGELTGALKPLVVHAKRVDDFIAETQVYRLEDQAMHATQTAELKDLIASTVGIARTGVMSSVGELKATMTASVAQLEERLKPLEAESALRKSRAARKRGLQTKAGILAGVAVAMHECWDWVHGALLKALAWHRPG